MWVALSKKTPAESAPKTPGPDKKAKLVTPQKTGVLCGFRPASASVASPSAFFAAALYIASSGRPCCAGLCFIRE
ncbi:hypothetical protein U1Q18_026401 [Sarracenia purpurea var. burkii]